MLTSLYEFLHCLQTEASAFRRENRLDIINVQKALHCLLYLVHSGSESFFRAQITTTVAAVQARLKDRLQFAYKLLVTQLQALFVTFATSLSAEAPDNWIHLF